MRRLVLVTTLLLTASLTVAASPGAVVVRTVVVRAKVINQARPQPVLHRTRRRRIPATAHAHHIPRPLSPAEFGRPRHGN